MKALLVIDLQKGFIKQREYSETLKNIEAVVQSFKKEKEPIIFTRHIDLQEGSSIYYQNEGSQILDEFVAYADYIIEKKTPDSFRETELAEILAKNSVDQIVITGFNTEFCCFFTAIAGFDRKYKVTFVEDATNTVNDADVYEMPGLDIIDFVGTVLYSSGIVEDLDTEDYLEKYNK